MAKGATHVLGLDIGTQAIKAVELKLVGNSVRLLGEPVVIATPAQSVAAGRIVERQAVAEALAEMLPSDTDGLLAISGIGPDKVSRYGSDLLALLDEQRHEVPSDPMSLP